MLDFQLVKEKDIFFKKKALLLKNKYKYSTGYCIIHFKTYIFAV